jgi:hypothetical protein
VQQGWLCEGGGLAPACPAHACRNSGGKGSGEAALAGRMLVPACLPAGGSCTATACWQCLAGNGLHPPTCIS